MAVPSTGSSPRLCAWQSSPAGTGPGPGAQHGSIPQHASSPQARQQGAGVGAWGERQGVWESARSTVSRRWKLEFIAHGCGLWGFFPFTRSWQLAGGWSWPQLTAVKGAAPHGTPDQPPAVAGPRWVPALHTRAPAGSRLRSPAHECPSGVSSRSSGRQGSPTTGTSWPRRGTPTASSSAFPSTCEDRSTSSPRRQVPAAPAQRRAGRSSGSEPAQTARASQSVDRSEHTSLPDREDEDRALGTHLPGSGSSAQGTMISIPPRRFLPAVPGQPAEPLWLHAGVSQLWCLLRRFHHRKQAAGREERAERHPGSNSGGSR